MTANSQGIRRGVQQGSQDLLGLQSVAQRVTRTLATVGAGLSAGMALRGLIQTGSSFEKVMSEVAARTGAVGNDFARLNELAEQLGRTTIFDGDAAGRAMVELSKAGFNVEQIMASVGDVLSLAAADNLDLAEAAAITAGALKKFELDAAQAGRVTDVLAKGAGRALTDVSTLGEQLAYAAGPAREAGYAIESTVAALGVLSDKVDKSQAGTGLRQVIVGLAKPAAEAQAALDSLGIKTSDAMGNFRPLADIVDDFNDAIGGMASGDKLRTLSTIFETRTANAFAGLMSAGGDELRRLTAELENAGGEAARLAAQMTDNVSGAFTSLMSAIKGFATDTFQLFAGPLKDGLNGLASFITGPVKTAFDSLGPFIQSTFAAVASTVGSVVSAMRNVITAFGVGVAAVAAFHAAVVGVSLTVAALVAVGKVLISPLVLAAATIGGLIVSVMGGLDGIKAAIATVADRADSLFVQIAHVGSAAWDAVSRAASHFGNAVSSLLSPLESVLGKFESLSLAGLDFGAVVEHMLSSVEFFFANWESYLDIGLTHLELWGSTIAADLSHLFTQQIPSFVNYMVAWIGKQLSESQNTVAQWITSIPGFETVFGVSAEDALRELKEMREQSNIALPEIVGSRTTPTDAEQLAMSRIAGLNSQLDQRRSAFMDTRQAELENRRITAAVERAGKSAWEQMMAGSPTGDLPTSSDNNITPPRTGVAAINDRQGPGIAMRGTQAAFDAINRAIRGSHADQKHKEQIGVLNQIATNTATQPEMPVVASI